MRTCFVRHQDTALSIWIITRSASFQHWLYWLYSKNHFMSFISTSFDCLKRHSQSLQRPVIQFHSCINSRLLQNISTIANLILIWTEEQTYWIAARFLMLGFELDLYSPLEYGMVYWYLYIVLMKLLDKTRLRLATNVNTCK